MTDRTEYYRDGGTGDCTVCGFGDASMVNLERHSETNPVAPIVEVRLCRICLSRALHVVLSGIEQDTIIITAAERQDLY